MKTVKRGVLAALACVGIAAVSTAAANRVEYGCTSWNAEQGCTQAVRITYTANGFYWDYVSGIEAAVNA